MLQLSDKEMNKKSHIPFSYVKKRALFVPCFIRARARSNPLQRKGAFVKKTWLNVGIVL